MAQSFAKKTTPLRSMKRTISFTTRLDMWGEGQAGAMNMAQLFHAQNDTPLTWMVGIEAADKYHNQLKHWHDTYGDEIGITLMYKKSFLEELGIKDSGESLYGQFQAITHYAYQDQLAQIRYLKQHVQKKLGLPVKLVGSLWNNSDTVRACEIAGFETFWGFCWHQAGVDNATFRGGLSYPFFVSAANPKIPRQTEGGMVGAFWVLSDMVNSYHLAQNVPTAIHPFEQCRNGVPLELKYGERLLRECYKQTQWNDFIHLSIHLESSWAHGPALELLKEWLAFCQKMDVRVITETEFTDWFRMNYKSMPTQVWHFTDVLADRPELLGRQHSFADMVYYGSQRRSIIFSKDKGILPIEITRYDLVFPTAPMEPYPSVSLPTVRVQQMTATEHDPLEISVQLHSEAELEEYAIILWDLELPANLKEKDISHTDNITFLRILNQAGAIAVGFNLQKGSNSINVRNRTIQYK